MLVLIYILVVGWFQSFLRTVVIMAAIPLSLVVTGVTRLSAVLWLLGLGSRPFEDQRELEA